MSDHEEMAKLGFHRDGHTYRRGLITIRFGFGAVRPWYAMKGKTSLRTHGDMLYSGRLRKFSTPMAAARAAVENWGTE